MSKKNMLAQLRNTLTAEEVALERRFGKADAVTDRLEQEGTTLLSSPTPTPLPGLALPSEAQTPKRGVPKATDLHVRESVSMPREDQVLLDRLQDSLRTQGMYEITRSQIVRAGIAELGKLEVSNLMKAVQPFQRTPPGRKPGASH